MATQQLQEIGEFKVGDSVLIEKTTTGYKAIRNIEKITSGHGGTIFVDGMRFDQHGRQRGDTWHSALMRHSTEQDLIDIKGANAKRRILKIRWNEVTPEQALEIESFLNKIGIETKNNS
jgi:hypothetical protein